MASSDIFPTTKKHILHAFKQVRTGDLTHGTIIFAFPPLSSPSLSGAVTTELGATAGKEKETHVGEATHISP